VANILSVYGVTHLPTLQAAVLHDTVEDTDTTEEEISAEFGEEVARIVSVSYCCFLPRIRAAYRSPLTVVASRLRDSQECTDPPGLGARARKDLQVTTAPKKSKEAQQVKLADKLHNLRSILEDPPVGWTAQRCQDYFRKFFSYLPSFYLDC
jgi:(p)ppGpp synthase/HD superfamily hydrolase